jgi:hypothetical protein
MKGVKRFWIAYSSLSAHIELGSAPKDSGTHAALPGIAKPNKKTCQYTSHIQLEQYRAVPAWSLQSKVSVKLGLIGAG